MKPRGAVKTRRLTGAACVGLLLPALAAAQEHPLSPAVDADTAEVVVTARKIEESLQDIPMSVQALSGEFIAESRATRLHELQFVVPGFVVNTVGMFGASFSMRGMSDQRVGGLSIAPHLNGVYLGDANVAVGRLFDVERVEVLKGPQGTLYGRNATGGSLNMITRAPQPELGSEIEVSYGSFETTRAQGFVNLPAGGVDFRLAFMASEGDGYIRNTVDNRRFAEDDYWGVRGSLRVDTSDAWILDVMAQHIRDDGAAGDLWTPNPLYLPDPRDIRLTTVTLENPYLISEIDNLSINLEYDLGFATLRSVTGYVRSDVRNLDDCAGEPWLAGCVRSSEPNDFEQWSQEVQLVFRRSGSLEGIVGAYYSDADAELGFAQLFPEIHLQPQNNNLTSRSEPYAALFGQVTFHFDERWTSTAGLRFSREEASIATIGSGLRDIHTPFADEIDTDNLSWLLDVTYAASDDVMLYASASTGYKSGGFVTTAPPNGVPDRYDPEYVTAFELGEKSSWLSGRLMLNAAAFLYDYEDLQVSTIILTDDGFIVDVDNAAEARIYGLDVETSYALTERWSVTGGAVWLPEREFVEYRTDGDDVLSGNQLVRAPEWSARAAIDYEHPLGDIGNLSARLEYNYRSSYFYTVDNDPDYWQAGFGLLNAYLRFEPTSDSWYVFASGRNLTEEDYFTQVFFQSSPGYPDTYEVGFGIRF